MNAARRERGGRHRSPWRACGRYLLGVLVLTALFGCGPSDPMDLRVSAESAEDFASWRRRAELRSPRGPWPEFAAMVSELQWEERARGTAPAAIGDAISVRVHRHSVREVIVLGQRARVGRLRREGLGLRDAARTNAFLVAKPGDEKSKAYLSEFQERQAGRLKATTAALAEAEKRIRELGGEVPPPDSPATFDPTPEARTPLAARNEVAELIRGQRDALRVRWGDTPIAFDHEGLLVTGDERSEFLALRRQAEASGRIAVAVRLQGRWWLYEAAREIPEWPAPIRDALTTTDREMLERAWIDLQAERWARQKAKEATPKS